ncbi:hypothetical protein TSA1_30680 [Bradyrhizobium nitroreducens]|uniref:Lipoprotein n=2 Tax=Bradyrhizobium nitroreducens TaxID=709803 RepID=A0A2M6UJ43_9BRAD|nr:hypothetical protein TSA1_30680 [Bradyrhizobium nitroreducens]
MRGMVRGSFLVFLLFTAGEASAETDFERKIREDSARHPGKSLVFLEVRVIEENGSKNPGCSTTKVVLGSDHVTLPITTQRTVGMLGFPVENGTYGGAALLAPGTYAVSYVNCSQYLNLKGDFARFRVGPDEIVNLGSLVIDFTRSPQFLQRTFTSRTKVEDLSEKAKASLTERSPVIFPKATKRYMTPNPATSGSQARAPEKRN